MYYNDLNEAAKRPELLATLAGLINPATIGPAIALGAIGITGIIAVKAINKLKTENNQLQEDKGALEADLEQLTCEAECESESDFEPYEKPLNSTVDNGSPNGLETVENTVENMDDEALQKEMIRQTMSELGKRSAAARARKKQEND
jgi:hypothetical protein